MFGHPDTNAEINASRSWFQGLNLASSTPGKVRRRRWLVFLAVAVMGIAASWVGFRLVRDESQRERGLQFEQQATQVAAELQTSFDLSLEHLLAIPPYFAASTKVTREEFTRFVSPIHARRESLYVSAFLARVSAAERTAFEAATRAEGLNDFAIHAVDREGKEVPMKPRATYFPILFSVPLMSSNLLGIDIGSHPEQAKYVELARAAVGPVATPPLSLIEDPEDVLSVMAFVAVRLGHTADDDDCDGIAVVILRVRPLVEDVLGPKRLDELQLVLTDSDAEGARQLVHKNFPGDAQSIHQAGWPVAEREVRFADQIWALTLSPATGSTFAPAAPPYWILGAGCVLSLLAAYSLSARIAIGGLRRQVNKVLELGQYQLDDKIGEGGMGEVYRAHHAMLARPTAVKLLRVDRSSPVSLARFEREVQLTSQLTHPNTIQIYDFGRTEDGVFYYAMEYLDGVNLAELIASHGPLPPRRTAQILLQVCGSLGEAHDAGLIHRDIKPANIMVTCRGGIPDFVKVLDFGLVKNTVSDHEPTVTAANVLAGTPLYFSPEATQGAKELDHRSDIYSLGVVAYEMLTGSPPFQSASPIDICMQHATKLPPALSEDVREPMLHSLEKLIMQCLEKSPDERPQEVTEIRTRLEEIVTEAGGWSDEDAETWWSARRGTNDENDTAFPGLADTELLHNQQSKIQYEPVLVRPGDQ